jgi:type IV secretion system protein VirB11
MTIDGSDADRNDRLPLGFGQLFVVERDDNKPHTAVRRNEKLSILMSRTPLPVSLLIEEHGSIPKDAVRRNRRYISSIFNMSTLAVVHDEQHQRLEVKLRRELGDQVLRLLDDTLTEDILLNPDGSLWVKRMGHGFARIGEMPAAQAASALGTIAAWRGTVLNHEHPVLETELPIDGSRFEGIVSPVVRRPVFAIRLRPRKIFSLDDYEADGILTDGTDPLNQLRRRDDFLDGVRGQKDAMSHAEVIRAAVRARKNILVVGSTGSGKTTLVNAILDSLARLTPHDRVISIEDTTELQCPVKNYLDLRAVGNVTMLECLRACMRLKPTRIVVGEVRGAEAHTLLKAWNTGHPGGAATVHANDALSGLIRLESLVAEATSAPQQTLIAEAVDLVVFVDEESSVKAGRKVREVLLVTGYSNGNYQVERV